MRFKQRLVLGDALEDLRLAREALDFGSNLVLAERQVRAAMRELSVAGLERSDDSAAIDAIAEAELLLGRALRLRGFLPTAEAWLVKSSRLFETSFLRAPTPWRADRLSECMNHLTLTKLNLVEAHRRQGDLDISLHNAVAQQQAFFAESAALLDRGNHYLEAVQRAGDAIALTRSARDALDYLEAASYGTVAEDRPDQNRALRYIHLALRLVDGNRLDRAADFLQAAEAIPAVQQSHFVRVLFLEAITKLYLASGDAIQAERTRTEASRLQAIEELVHTSPRATPSSPGDVQL